MRKELEHRGRKEPQRTQRKKAIRKYLNVSFYDMGGFRIHALTCSISLQQLSFLCVLCGISVSSVFLLFFRQVGLG
jgi:hypothetical protein